MTKHGSERGSNLTGAKESPRTIAELGDEFFFDDMCTSFSVSRGERDVHNLVFAMANRIVELTSPQLQKKRASGGRPPKWTTEAEAALIVDVQQEMTIDNSSLAAVFTRLASVEPWKRFMANCDEQGAPEALKRAYTRARKNILALDLVEVFKRYRTELGRDIWRARTRWIIDASISIDRSVRLEVKLALAKSSKT